MGRRNAKTKRATFAEEVEDRSPMIPSLNNDEYVVPMNDSEDTTPLPAGENSRVFWRTNTSFSEAEDDDKSSGDETSTEGGSVTVLEPTCAKAESLRQRNEELLEVPVEHQKSYTVVESDDKKKTDVYVQVDLEKYMAAREMTPLQERMNALTMIPPPLICLFFLLSGNWISTSLLAETMQEMRVHKMSLRQVSAAFDANPLCMDWSNTTGIGWLFENVHAMPPLPLLAIVIGVVIHAPWSFLYHWRYAHRLPPAKRTDHWSRRMDQAMLHVSSALTSFGTCGFLDFFLINVVFNADSFYRQFLPEVKPKRNQNRLGVAIVAWTIPIMRRGDWDLFFRVFVTLALGIFLFVKYPIGRWSHAAFHMMLIPLMPLLMEVGTTLPASQDHLSQAAQCFALAEHRATFY